MQNKKTLFSGHYFRSMISNRFHFIDFDLPNGNNMSILSIANVLETIVRGTTTTKKRVWHGEENCTSGLSKKIYSLHSQL